MVRATVDAAHNNVVVQYGFGNVNAPLQPTVFPFILLDEMIHALQQLRKSAAVQQHLAQHQQLRSKL